METCLTIGNFDGVHRGHQLLLSETLSVAKQDNLTPAALTFSPHPRRFFQPEAPAFQLQDTQTKTAALKHYGVEQVFTQRFDADFAQLSACDFLTEIVMKQCNAKRVVVGDDFVYGHKRSGNAQTLKADCKALGLTATIITKHECSHNEDISSSRIRDALRNGKAELAAQLLGRAWQTSHTVLRGEQRGRTIGFPTLNLKPSSELLYPQYGVYAFDVNIASRTYRGAGNWGHRPTYPSADPLLEIHLIDYSGADLYGETITVKWRSYLRAEKKFKGLAALKKQLVMDCKNALAVHD